MTRDQALDRFVKQRRALGVEAGQRLVEQHDLRLGEEGHRDPQALALAHRHAVDAAVGQLTKVEGVDRPLDLEAHLGRGHHRDPGPELELVADRKPRIEAAVAGR